MAGLDKPRASGTHAVSHYLFKDRFGRSGKGNDKGKVEGLVKYARANFMTPIPVAASFEAFNVMLSERCHTHTSRERHAETLGERLAAGSATIRELPATPLEPCEKRAARVSSTALVRYRGNDYSVPTAYGFQDVVVKGFVAEVVILCRGEAVARHALSGVDRDQAQRARSGGAAARLGSPRSIPAPSPSSGGPHG